jgi:hypothetical protein
MFLRFLWILIIIHFSVKIVEAQNDTIVVNNDIVLVGTLKKMTSEMFTIETDFSSNDIRIEWENIKYVNIQSNLLISDGDGNRYYGKLETVGADSILLITDENEQILLARADLFYLEQIDKGFKHHVFFSIDVGFSMTQANNLMQLTSNSKFGYRALRWILEGRFNGLTSSQDETETIKRWDRNIGFTYMLPGNWLINPEVNFFSSTEQKINLRIVPRLGIGKIIVRTSKVSWNCTGGLNMNFEDYSGDAEDRNSIEGYFGTGIDLINVGDLDFFGEFVTYPSLTENGRWRYDLSLDLRYNLPLDFYLTTGYTFNFDNRPTEGATGNDYLFNVGVGWQW